MSKGYAALFIQYKIDRIMKKPDKSEFHPNYQRYIDLVHGGSFEDLLPVNTRETVDFFTSIDPVKYNYRYRESK